MKQPGLSRVRNEHEESLQRQAAQEQLAGEQAREAQRRADSRRAWTIGIVVFLVIAVIVVISMLPSILGGTMPWDH